MASKEISVVRSDSLSSDYQDRYIIINSETGEVLDDAQGYGYKSKQSAYAAWSWKNRPPETKEQKARKARLKQWLKTHRKFVDCLENSMRLK